MMARVMFGWKWSDGKWYDAPEPGSQPGQVRHTRRGTFTTRPLSPYETQTRRDETRQWLITLLRKPRPAAEVWERARRKGIPVMPLKRAKRHFKIKSYRVGGFRTGCWIWALS